VKQAVAPGLLADLTTDNLQSIHSAIRANLLRALELTQPGKEDAGWAYDGPEIPNSQGKACRVTADRISESSDRTSGLHQLQSKDSHLRIQETEILFLNRPENGRMANHMKHMVAGRPAAGHRYEALCRTVVADVATSHFSRNQVNEC